MKLLKKTVLIGTTLLLGSFLLAACGNTNKEANNADKTHEVNQWHNGQLDKAAFKII